ncbi:MAG: PD40 domain-containing protein [Gemmatimonadales bacterium]|nr:PD40 domain-containing protein [Gemmatimonadales bacterium]
MTHSSARLWPVAVAAAVFASSLAAQPAARRPDLPLTPARTAAFTTTTGSWMSLDVSPDGQTIVFDLLGDLYTLPISGGKATRLTSGLPFDAQPRFSPDGKRIAFVSDRSGGDNLWIISLDRRDTVQVTRGNNNTYVSPEWTPDGKYLVASRTSGGPAGPPKLWLFHVDGGTGLPLITAPQPLKTVGAAFGNDGRYIWYASRTGDFSYNVIFPAYQLHVYDRETGHQSRMSSRYGSAFRPALSPDGKWLVYGTREKTETGLRIRDLATGEERWLAYPVQRDEQESRASLDVLPGYSFTPDSRAVIVSYGGEIWRVGIDGGPATKIPFTADVSVDVGPHVKFTNRVDTTTTFHARQIRDITPSPDGKRIAFTALGRVYVADYPAGTPQRLTDQDIGEHSPVWAPDGSAIAFATWSDAAGGHLMRAPVVRGGRARAVRLSDVPGSYDELVWAPNGRIVAVQRATRDLQDLGASSFLGASGAANLIWVPATGGAVALIAPSAGRSRPHFAGDAERIYAYSRTDGLVSFRWDGTDQRSHLKVTAPTGPAGAAPDFETMLRMAGNPSSDLPQLGLHPDPTETGAPAPPAGLVIMAPSGDQALAYVGMDLYLVTVPQVGGTTPTVSLNSPDNAAVPVKRINDIGGQFPTWNHDGTAVFWSIGNAALRYDLARARAVDDSLKLAARQTAADTAARADSTRRQAAARAGYRPDEHRILVAITRDTPRGVAVLRGGRAVTMKGREIIDNADIVVRDNRIIAIGPRGQVNIPAGAREIDVSGKTVIPGFVDIHYHPQWLVPNVHTNQVWQYLATLAYGTTTTRDPQTAVTDVLTYQDRVETGEMIGPRIYHTGPGVFSGERIRDLDHARNVLRRYSDYYGVTTLKMYGAGNRQQRQWIIMAAKELGIMPTTEGSLDIRLNLTHAIDGYPGIEHNLPVAPLFKDVVELFKTSQTTSTPTLVVTYGGPWGEQYFYTNENPGADPKLQRFTPQSELDYKVRRRGAGNGPGAAGWFAPEEYAMHRHGAFIKDLIENGGRAGVGSHGQLQGLSVHWEIWAMQKGGLNNHDMLRVATIYGAEAIGMEMDIGTLEAGKMADILVLDRNPLDDIRNTNSIRYVMKDGRLYEADTLNEIYPRQRPLPTQWWMNGSQSPRNTPGLQ